MPTYLVESYTPRTGVSLKRTIARVQDAASELAAEGVGLRHVRSTFVPEDELCLYVFEAESATAVDEVGRRAGLSFERVVEAMPLTPGESVSPSREEAS